MISNRITKRNEQMFLLYEDGTPVFEIAKEFELQNSTVVDYINRHRERNGIKRNPTVKCEFCGVEFKPKSYRHIYCTVKCRESAYEAEQYSSGRFLIYKRDEFTCIYCGATPISEDCKTKLHCDHIYPKSLGGLDEAGNLVTACQNCNGGKSAMALPEEIIRNIKQIVEQRNAKKNINSKLTIKL